jgi:hypothetical protein
VKKEELVHHYILQKKSSAEIAFDFNISVSKINYWLSKHRIPKRSISESIYQKKNPKGDPFDFKEPQNIRDAILFGTGIGLFWGEGNKKNKHAVRLGNTDPELIKTFICFLVTIFNIKKEKLRFALQVFNDSDPKEALSFWSKELGFPKNYFMPTVVVSTVRGPGTYKNKSEYGVLTVHFNNMKLKEKLMSLIENIG